MAIDDFVEPPAPAELNKGANYGSYNGSVKLTVDKVKTLLLTFAEGGRIPDRVDYELIKSTAASWDVHDHTLDLILMGETWRHVLPEIERAPKLTHILAPKPAPRPKPTQKSAAKPAPSATMELPEWVLRFILEESWPGLDVPTLRAVLDLPIKPRSAAGFRALVAAYIDSQGGKS